MARQLNQESWCMRCNRMLPSSSFYRSFNPNHTGGYLPYCKDCLKKIFSKNLEEVGSLQGTLWATLAEAGVPFVQRVADDMQERLESKHGEDFNMAKTGVNFIGNYLRSLHTMKQKKDVWETFKDTDVPMDNMVSLKERKQKIEAEIANFKLDWGNFDSTEEYAFLEYRYDVYTEGMALKPAQETLYRKLCIAELNARKIEARGESTKDIQKQILDLMSKLKIDNFAEVKDKDLTEQLLESQIALHEREMPMEFYEDKNLYKDACGLAEGWEEIKRCMINFPFSQKEYPKIKKVDDGN